MTRRLKNNLFILFLLFSCILSAQEELKETEAIEKLIIPIERESGTYIHQIDSVDQLLNYSNSLDELFRNSSAFNVNSFGNGNINTFSFRGLRGENTRLDWHGINLNAPSTGLTDLALIRSSLFKNITLFSDEFPGSVIKLENEVPWNDRSLELGLGLSSFNGSDYSGTYHVGNEDFYSRTHLDYFKKDNDFFFRNTDSIGRVNQQRINTAHNGWNFQQDVGYISRGRSSKNTYSGHIWYSKYDRNLPSDIRLPSAFASQDDRSFKLALKSVLEDGDFQWSNVLGYINDRQDFREDSIINSVDSTSFNAEYNQRRIHLNSSFQYKLDNYFFNGGLELRTMNVTSTNYGLIKPESAAGFWGKAQRNWNMSRLVFSIKQEFSSVYKVPFNTSIGYDHYFKKSKLWAGVKRLGRTATYDDLFLRGIGNPELDPENGWAFETGWQLRPGDNADLNFNIYQQSIKNWIQVIPDSVLGLRPVNYSEVSVRGFNLNYKQFFTGSNADFMSKISVSYNNTELKPPSLGLTLKRLSLVYSPEWTAQITLALLDGPRRFGYRSKFVGSQFTDELNMNSIPYSWIHDVFFVSEIADRVQVAIQANNLSNATYFSIDGFPMQTRNFSINLIYRTVGSEDKEIRAKTRSNKIKFKKRGAW